MKRYTLVQLEEFAEKILRAKGLSSKDAKYIAKIVVNSEAMGIKTHGIAFLGYVDAQQKDNLDPTAKPVIVKEKGSTVLIDGNGGFAQLAMKLAVEKAAEKAKANWVAMVGIRNCAWMAAVGAYLLPLAKEGFLCELWAQTSTCVDAAPVGGLDGKFSTNPVALAFPAEPNPVIADFATTIVSMGKVNVMAKAGQFAPEEIFMDKDGNYSSDPKVVQQGGTILFLGGKHYGHKGYGLSLWNEALTAMAGGSCNNPASKTRQSFNLTVIDPEAFGGMKYYNKEMQRFLMHVKDSRLKPGVDKIRLPGEYEIDAIADSEKNGIPLAESMVQTLNNVARKYNITELPV